MSDLNPDDNSKNLLKPPESPKKKINDNSDATTNTSNTLATGSGNATGSGRTKVALTPGHSLMDWIRYCAEAKDIAGTGGKLINVTEAELAKHNTKEDCWLAINGKVFNVTPYVNYHPGGADKLMEGAGIDATEIFNDIHSWVNYESMLAKCLVGKYCPGSTVCAQQ